MTEGDETGKNKSVGMSMLAGLFIWIVFDSIALGVVAAFATYWLMQRDAEDEA